MTAPFTQLEAGLAVLRVAQQFLDLHEVESNARWSRPVDSDALRALLAATGWQPGWPYCMAFVEACYGTAAGQLAGPAAEALVRAKFTPHVQTTFRNVGALVRQGRPVPGSVFFMRKGQTTQGHAGLVLLAGARTMATLEGNTSPGVTTPGKDREGDGIYLKVRPIIFAPTPGLYLQGFLDPLDQEGVQALLHSTVPGGSA